MSGRPLVSLFCFFALFFGAGALHPDQTKDAAAPSGGANDSPATKKGDARNQSPDADTSAGSGICTVRPDSAAGKAGAAAKDDSDPKSGAAAQDKEAAQHTASPDQQNVESGSKSSLTEVWTLSVPTGGAPQPDWIALPANTINAAEIAPKLSMLSSRILAAIAVSPSKIVLVVNTSKLLKDERSTLRSSLSLLAANLAFTQAPSGGTPPAPRSGISPYVFSLILPAGTGKACDIAHALVDASPYVSEITAVDDARLLISLSGSAPDLSTIEATLRELAGELSTAPEVGSIVQRLYYNRDPTVVAAIINDAYPNVTAQALPPDLVVLSDFTDIDHNARQGSLKSAQRTIARIDQPHPQVSVDAWSLQLAAEHPDDLGNLIPPLENLANGYNEAIDDSLAKGWEYLSSLIADPQSLDPLMSHYLTWTTQVSGDSVQRVEQPYSSKLPNARSEAGYGLGYSTLYYPLTPNLIDMLVTLVSLRDPRSAADSMLGEMGTPAPYDPHNTCREEDQAVYEKETKADKQAKLEEKRAHQPEDHKLNRPAPTPHPSHLHLACVRHAIMDGLLAVTPNGASSTSGLGQIRGALADFLFHYKLMVDYRDDFESYREPIAADTLDSALAPIVAAFGEDLSVFQASLQAQVARTIAQGNKNIKYGYGGLVSLKVLSSQPGKLTTATQNYFDVTPPATLNDLLTNLQTVGASAEKTPLSSLVTSLTPAKTVELLTVLGQTLTPKTATAHLGRGLDLEVTAHSLSGAIGAELDLKVNSTENGAAIIQPGSDKPGDDLNSRVSQHSIDTHVRVNSINLFPVSTLSSTLARGRAPWKPFDPIEVPVLSLLFKKARSPQIVQTQSLVFVDAVVVPTAVDLGYGVPINSDVISGQGETYKKLRTLEEFPNSSGMKLMQYNNKIVDCLNREYIDSKGSIRVQGNGRDNHNCGLDDYQFNSLPSYDPVE